MLIRKFFGIVYLKLVVGTLFVLWLCPLAECQVIPEQPINARGFFIAFCCLVVGGIAANALLVGMIRPQATRSTWLSRWEFTPDDLGGFSWRALAMWSLL